MAYKNPCNINGWRNSIRRKTKIEKRIKWIQNWGQYTKTYSLEISQATILGLHILLANTKREIKAFIYVTCRVIRLKQTSCSEEILTVLELRLKKFFFHGHGKNSKESQGLFFLIPLSVGRWQNIKCNSIDIIVWGVKKQWPDM